MSTLWTPDGERPVQRQSEPPRQPPPESFEEQPDEAEMAAQLEQLSQQLAAAPVEAIVANHAYGLFQLAAVHLSQQPPQLPQARLAVDALTCLVEGLAGRLGETEAELAEGLAQLRLAYVQITKAAEQPDS